MCQHVKQRHDVIFSYITVSVPHHLVDTDRRLLVCAINYETDTGRFKKSSRQFGFRS